MFTSSCSSTGAGAFFFKGALGADSVAGVDVAGVDRPVGAEDENSFGS